MGYFRCWLQFKPTNWVFLMCKGLKIFYSNLFKTDREGVGGEYKIWTPPKEGKKNFFIINLEVIQRFVHDQRVYLFKRTLFSITWEALTVGRKSNQWTVIREHPFNEPTYLLNCQLFVCLMEWTTLWWRHALDEAIDCCGDNNNQTIQTIVWMTEDHTSFWFVKKKGIH